MSRAIVLSAEDITKRFYNVTALDSVSLNLGRGEIVGLIGPNGSGKTTMADVLTGFHLPDVGTVRLEGVPVVGLRPHALRRLGVARTFQNLRLFDELTVFDNILIGEHLRFLGAHGSSWGWIGAMLRTPGARAREEAARERAWEVLEWVGLAHKAWDRVKHLSYGQRKRVEFSRALAIRPKVLVLDEPMAGISLDETDVILDLMRQTARTLAVGIVFIEHRLELVWSVCDRITVLSAGREVLTGSPDEIQQHAEVRRAYLGE